MPLHRNICLDCLRKAPKLRNAIEDFAYYSRVVPSCFSFIGLIPSGRNSYPMLHTPQFDFTDAALATGIRLMCGYALRQDAFASN